MIEMEPTARIANVMSATILLLGYTLNSFIFSQLMTITLLWIMEVNAQYFIENILM